MTASQSEFAGPRRGPVKGRHLISIAAYFSIFVLAEVIAAFASDPGEATLGMVIQVLLLFTLLFHAALLSRTDKLFSRFLAVFALPPLIRILSLSTPPTPFNVIQWLLIISLPLLAAGATMAYVMKLRPRDVYLRLGGPRVLVLQAPIALSGLALGAMEFLILQPTEPWIPALTLQHLIPAAIIIGIASGLAEELIFRGLILPKSETILGRLPGLLFISLLFAAMHIGFRSAIDLVFVFGVGFYFGYVVQRTKSLYGVIFAHGLANVALYLILPFYF